MDKYEHNKATSSGANVIPFNPFAAAYGDIQDRAEVEKLRKPLQGGRVIQTSGEWTADWHPPSWLILGILQRRFLYSLTAPAGAGKTALALTLAAHVALGRDLGSHRVRQGRVLYLAGENPDDIKTRWLAVAEALGFDPNTIPVDFVEGVSALGTIKLAAAQTLGYALVIVDTDQAYFDGDDMNDNTARKRWAQKLRTLVNLPGGPAVLVLAHPPKEAVKPPFRPYGGNALLNEFDANTYLERHDKIILLKRDPQKFRGPEFDPVPFTLHPIISTTLADDEGTPVMSVMAVPLTADAYAAIKAKAADKDAELRQKWEDDPGLTFSQYAELFGFEEPARKGKNKASRLIKKWQKADSE